MGIKLSISNIAWNSEHDQQMYEYLKQIGYAGLEIAPTRVFPEKPYEKLQEAREFAKMMYEEYGLKICSLQSIWYGRSEKIYGSSKERNALMDYTKTAIDFAEIIGADNLVFGCPKNRCIEREEDWYIAADFFKALGDYATEHKTVLALEANPVIYGTNFVNKTNEAIKLIKKVESKGFKLNLDFGTIIYNEESITDLIPYIELINHVHISEPNLRLIARRDEHKELLRALRDGRFNGFVSIEMRKQEDINSVLRTIDYVAAL